MRIKDGNDINIGREDEDSMVRIKYPWGAFW
jgi:hypothetical protein